MNREELWAKFLVKNPSFGDPREKITLTGAGIRKLFEQAWKHGSSNGFDKGIKFAKQNPDKRDDPMHMFNNLFNK